MADLPIARVLSSLTDRVAGLHDGAPASYIPVLAEADPDWFGMALVTMDGHGYSAGDSNRAFTIQSVSKPFSFGLVLDAHGPEAVARRVGVEPTGDPFNSIAVEETSRRAHNPMVNAGAIVAASMIPGKTLEDRWEALRSGFERFVGHPLDVCERTFASEQSTGDRNRAIAWFMRAFEMLPAEVDDVLDLYFRQCSLLVTAEDLAVMAATLANGGINPTTGARALSAESTVRVLSVMTMCGMYDFSGEWMYRVGLPAKSGVSGGVLAVAPGQLGFAVFSPPVDERGNSVRGIAACEELATRFRLELHQAHEPGLHAVRRMYRGDVVHSKRRRPSSSMAWLRAEGSRLGVVEVQGELFFASAEVVSRAVCELLPTLDYVIVDGRRVTTVDRGALEVLAGLAEIAAADGVQLVCSSLPGAHTEALFPTLDEALEWCEDELLRDHDLGRETGEFATQQLLAGLDGDTRRAVDEAADVRTYEPGSVVFHEGDDADGIYSVVAGSLSVSIAAAGEQQRIATLGPGATFGEMAVLDGKPRSTTVRADSSVTCRVLTLDCLSALESRFPGLRGVLYANLARELATRLRDANEEIRALS
ncbi:MAG TPA: glutaminase A [Acidimicrobiales bacterium]|nr:glutaminase A [Acidimicrobiales bacterium]